MRIHFRGAEGPLSGDGAVSFGSGTGCRFTAMNDCSAAIPDIKIGSAWGL